MQHLRPFITKLLLQKAFFGRLAGCAGLRFAPVLYREEQAVKELNPLHPWRSIHYPLSVKLTFKAKPA